MKKTLLVLGVLVCSMALVSCDTTSINSSGSETTSSNISSQTTSSDVSSETSIVDDVKNIPTYQGMKISTSSNQSSSIKSSKVKDDEDKMNSEEENTETSSGEQNTETTSDENEDTIGDTTIEEDIEDIVTIDVITDDEVKYYVEPNESFNIEIYLSNPDQYEIQSFTLNGKKYSSYMFEDGSTMELLKLKTTAPQTSGYFTYSLDAIKYIDGTDIKDVDLEGDKDIDVGVIYSVAPTASIISSDISTTSIDLDINIEDENDLIGEYPLEIYLTDGENIVDQKTLIVGQNNVTFNNLMMNTAYEYGIVTQYDLCDGRDVQENWLITDTFNTLNAYSFGEIVPSLSGVEFSLDTHGSTGELTSMTITDPNNETIVSTASSITNRSFSGLLSNHKYVINVFFTYSINSGIKNSSISQEFTTLAKSAPDVSVSSTEVTQNSIAFDVSVVDEFETGTLVNFQLYKGETLVETLQTTEEYQFTGLFSNTGYSIVVSYSYDLNDGFGSQESTAKSELITTLAKTAPVVTINNIQTTQESMTFDLSMLDEDDIGTIDSIDLYKGDEIVSTISALNDLRFDGLLSNTEYYLIVSYSYDLNDGEGSMINTVTSDTFTTLAKIAPTYSIETIEATQDSINFDVSINDVDSVGTINKIELFKDDSLVSTLSSTDEYEFTDLESNTEYTIVLEYSYDLNDGQGIQTGSVTQTKWTSPSVSFDSIRCLNTTAVSEGDIIVIQANVVNPDSVDFTTVVINNVEYPVSNVSTSTKIRVELSNEGQFEGGSTDLTISEIKGTLNDQIVLMTIDQNNVANVFINGALSVESVQFVDTDMNPIDYCFVNDEVKVLITLNNPTGYDLTQINDDSDLVLNEIDSNHYYIDCTNDMNYYGTQSCSLSDLSYSNEYMSKTIQFSSNVWGTKIVVCKEGIKQISTADDLLDMNDCYYYELENDIDLAGEDWSNPGSMYGVFNGNNYSINNMSSVNTFSDTDLRLGLFSSANSAAYVFDLNIEDALYMITLNGEESSDVYTGGLFADVAASSCKIENVNIDIEISITNNTGGRTYTGGVIGEIFCYDGTMNLENNTTTSTIDSTGDRTGGMIGYLETSAHGTMNLVNNTTTSTIDSTGSFTGGMIGYLFNSGTMNIINCGIFGQMNSGEVLVGYLRSWEGCSYSVSGCKCNITINGELITSIPDESTIES